MFFYVSFLQSVFYFFPGIDDKLNSTFKTEGVYMLEWWHYFWDEIKVQERANLPLFI